MADSRRQVLNRREFIKRGTLAGIGVGLIPLSEVSAWTPPAGPRGGATVVSADAVEFVRELKGQPGEDICLMGGGELARTFFEADLIDEIGFNVHPVLLGTGIPLFHPMNRQIDLELLECRPFKNGCVLVKYRVKHPTGRGKKTH